MKIKCLWLTTIVATVREILELDANISHCLLFTQFMRDRDKSSNIFIMFEYHFTSVKATFVTKHHHKGTVMATSSATKLWSLQANTCCDYPFVSSAKDG